VRILVAGALDAIRPMLVPQRLLAGHEAMVLTRREGGAAARRRTGAAGIYTVVDEEPASLRDWLPAYADALGAKPPPRVPRWATHLMRRALIADIGQSASNADAKAELGRRPTLTGWREGFRSALDSDPAAPPRDLPPTRGA
jgi:nucleoside-diphosphate-sugar epimerase